jgi:hypothetical protein
MGNPPLDRLRVKSCHGEPAEPWVTSTSRRPVNPEDDSIVFDFYALRFWHMVIKMNKNNTINMNS